MPKNDTTPKQGIKPTAEQHRKLKALGIDPDSDQLLDVLICVLEDKVDARLAELWRMVFGPDVAAPGEPEFGPCSDRRRHLFTGLIGKLATYHWPWTEGCTEDQARRWVAHGERPQKTHRI